MAGILGAKECILFATGITNNTGYLTRINKIRKDSKALINNEINGLGQLGIGWHQPTKFT